MRVYSPPGPAGAEAGRWWRGLRKLRGRRELRAGGLRRVGSVIELRELAAREQGARGPAAMAKAPGTCA